MLPVQETLSKLLLRSWFSTADRFRIQDIGHQGRPWVEWDRLDFELFIAWLDAPASASPLPADLWRRAQLTYDPITGASLVCQLTAYHNVAWLGKLWEHGFDFSQADFFGFNPLWYARTPATLEFLLAHELPCGFASVPGKLTSVLGTPNFRLFFAHPMFHVVRSPAEFAVFLNHFSALPWREPLWLATEPQEISLIHHSLFPAVALEPNFCFPLLLGLFFGQSLPCVREKITLLNQTLQSRHLPPLSHTRLDAHGLTLPQALALRLETFPEPPAAEIEVWATLLAECLVDYPAPTAPWPGNDYLIPDWETGLAYYLGKFAGSGQGALGKLRALWLQQALPPTLIRDCSSGSAKDSESAKLHYL